MIYLDYNATSPLRPEVKAVMLEAYDAPLNASSVHRIGRRAKRMLEDAREVVAGHFSCFSNEVIFTGSGTEANNIALRGFPDRPLLSSAIEHSSVKETASRLGSDLLRVNRHGVLDLDQLESKLKVLGEPALVSVMAANNETGVIQPIRQIADIVHCYGGLLHSDAVQMTGKKPLDMGALGVDLMTVAAHKMGGPIGVGALIMRNDIPIRPLMVGGSQELGRRAGTENIASIIGFAKALEIAEQDDWSKRMEALVSPIAQRLKAALPQLVVAGQDAERMPHVLCLMVPGLTSETQLMHLDLAGVCVSAGSACSSGRIAPSHVLKAMDYPDAMAGSAIRMSAGWASEAHELERFAEVWLEMAEKLVRSAA